MDRVCPSTSSPREAHPPASARQGGLTDDTLRSIQGQDRRARRQRRGQVYPAPHHGRRGHRVPRRGSVGDGCDGGHARAGAPGGSGKGRPRQRGGRRAPRSERCWTASTTWRPTTRTRPRTSSRPGSGQIGTRPTGGTLAGPSSTPWTPCAARPSDAAVDKLSGGERRGVALPRLLLLQPDLLLLDRPTTRLDAESVAWLERHLHDYQGTIVAVTHDRYFLDNVAGWILELDRGRGIPTRATTRPGWRRQQVVWPSEERQESAAGGRSRRSSNGCAPERLREPDQEQGAPGPPTRPSSPRTATSNRQGADPHPRRARLGDVVVEAEGLGKGTGDRLLIEDLTFSLPPGGDRRP